MPQPDMKEQSGFPRPRGTKNHGQRMESLGRDMGSHVIMFHQAVAERLGLTITDHKCLDFVLREGSVTAGQLSRLTGLTTGAITGVIDRLEKAGFARRQPDPHDRRKVIVVPRAERTHELGRLFESLSRNMGRVMSNYTARESEVIVDFMERAVNVMREENLKIRNAPKK